MMAWQKNLGLILTGVLICMLVSCGQTGALFLPPGERVNYPVQPNLQPDETPQSAQLDVPAPDNVEESEPPSPYGLL